MYMHTYFASSLLVQLNCNSPTQSNGIFNSYFASNIIRRKKFKSRREDAVMAKYIKSSESFYKTEDK